MPLLIVSSLLGAACAPADVPYVVMPGPFEVATEDEPTGGEEVFVDAAALRLADPVPNILLSGGELTFSEDGDAFAAWVASDNGNGDVWVARSRDGGGTWEAAVDVESGSSPAVAGGERRPYVVVDAARIAVIWTSNPDPATWIAIAPRTEGPLSFGAPQSVGTARTDDLEDFANGVFLSDGTLAVVTHVTVWGGSPEEALFVTRESDGWQASLITGDVPGEPCACCALDVLPTEDGGLLVAYRNNIDNIRDQFVLDVSAEGQVSWAQASFTNWEIFGCPMQGPRLLELSYGELLLFWSDPTAGDNQIWIARSEDGGATWAGQRGITADTSVTGSQKWPRAAVSGSHIHVAFHVGAIGWTAWSNDRGVTFSEPQPVQTSDGPLEDVQLAIGPQGAAMVGSSGAWPDAAIWFTPLE